MANVLAGPFLLRTRAPLQHLGGPRRRPQQQRQGDVADQVRPGARGGYDIHGRLDVHRNIRGRWEVPPARIGAVWYVPSLLVRSREHVPVSTGLHCAAGSLGAWRPSPGLCLPLLRVATLRDPGHGGHNPAGRGPAPGSFLTQMLLDPFSGCPFS